MEPLNGYVVVELSTGIAGGYCTKILADGGAEVIKVEPPDGDPLRKWSASGARIAAGDDGALFSFLASSKHSVVADPENADDVEFVAALLADADAVVWSRGSGIASHSAFTPAEIHRLHPHLTVTSITPFGLDGPWADRVSSDLVGLALGSPLNSCGYDDHSIPPIRPGGDQGYQSACSFALMALMLALVDRQHTGTGQVVDVGMHDCLSVSAELANPYWFYPKAVVHRQTCRHAQPTPTAPALFPCGDGRYVYFVLFVAALKPFRQLVDWMATLGVEADLVEPQYEDAAFRQANFGHVQELVEVFFLLQTAQEAYHAGQARGLPIGIAYAPDDLFHDEHLKARDFFVTIEHDDVPAALYPGAPIRFSSFASAPPSRAPRLGEHTDEVRTRARTAGADAR